MMRWALLLSLVLAIASAARAADAVDGNTLFEQHIRPVLVERCYECHSAQAKKLKGKLHLDSKQGIAQGGADGKILVPGQPEKSRLIEALKWTDPDLQMPPKQHLSAEQVHWFEEWIKLGAPDPREGTASAVPTSAPKRGMDLETGRKWWAFQPVKEVAPPPVKESAWVARNSDQFILAKLEESGLKPSPKADRRILIRRAYLDLTGLRPTYEQVEAFAKDDSQNAYEKLIDQLLASQNYGERWGRYWLDVVRYGEDNPTSEATNPPYPFAWRYRDWVIKALNADVPYDRFVKLQLAADEMPGTSRQDLVALGFLGAGPVYHKDARNSKDVITTLYCDDWDERIDTVTRGFLGLTVACARCHDHKFDPITSKDYYALQGVFASVCQVPRPLAEVDAPTETRFMAAEQRLFYLSYSANLLRDEPGSKPKEARQKVERFAGEMDRIMDDMSFLKSQHTDMYARLQQLDRRPRPYPQRPTTQPVRPIAYGVHDMIGGGFLSLPRYAGGGSGRGPGLKDAQTIDLNLNEGPHPNPPPEYRERGKSDMPPTVSRTIADMQPAPRRGRPNANAGAGAGANAFGNRRRRRGRGGSTAPFFEAVFDAGTYIDGSDQDFTMVDIRPGEARDMPVLPGGNPAHPGEISPRRFVAVLSKSDSTFHQGSGRRELGEKIFGDAAPLAARVIVNRVWAWHFGKPIVATQSDFGVQGEKPTHPRLLDDLAARFIAHRWSLKWLHKEIMLSAAYQQASNPREDGMRADPTNELIWRMNPRRLDAEAFRDCLLQASGALDTTMYGVSMDLDQPGNNRRTVYARIGRGRLNNYLQLFDFPEATMHSPGREVTTTPLQQLFVMNSSFIEDQASTLAEAVAKVPQTDRVATMYRKVFGRDPDQSELKLAADYFAAGGTPAQYAQALLSTNEVQFWP